VKKKITHKMSWYLEFVAEMEALGCKFVGGPKMFGDDEIQVPIAKQDEVKALIVKYSAKAARA
jgi:hypothetical protein